MNRALKGFLITAGIFIGVGAICTCLLFLITLFQDTLAANAPIITVTLILTGLFLWIWAEITDSLDL